MGVDCNRYVGVHTGRKNINYHVLKGRACWPLQRKKRAKLEPGFASVTGSVLSTGEGSESLPSGIGELCHHHRVAKICY
eukprot:183384-Amphidinium_carterae.1